jgi:mannose-6-phosphate isomerase-like protein (cupin superfamily)
MNIPAEDRMADWLFSLEPAERTLPDETSAMRFANALRHGSMRLGLYAPRGTDTQEPHTQDELYFVVSGSGTFIKNGEAKAFGPSDVVFVEAGAEHRFVEFTPDFAAWVVFWGPEGGEA